MFVNSGSLSYNTLMSKKKKRGSGGTIQNRRARFDYQLKDFYQAGLSLSGPEVRSLRSGHGSLQGAFVTIRAGEAWLNNSLIMPVKTNASAFTDDMQTRARKLLLKKREIEELVEAKNRGLTIVPTKLLTKSRFIKVEIALAKGKKQYDKREVIKKRDQERAERQKF